MFFQRAEAHDVFDAGAVVPAAVEDHDLAGGWKMRHVSLDEHLGFFAVRRRGKRHHSEHARADFFGDRLDRAALAGCVAPLEHDDHAKSARPYPALEMAKFDLKLAQLALIG